MNFRTLAATPPGLPRRHTQLTQKVKAAFGSFSRLHFSYDFVRHLVNEKNRKELGEMPAGKHVGTISSMSHIG